MRSSTRVTERETERTETACDGSIAPSGGRRSPARGKARSASIAASTGARTERIPRSQKDEQENTVFQCGGTRRCARCWGMVCVNIGQTRFLFWRPKVCMHGRSGDGWRCVAEGGRWERKQGCFFTRAGVKGGSFVTERVPGVGVRGKLQEAFQRRSYFYWPSVFAF